MRMKNLHGASDCSVSGVDYKADHENAVDVTWDHARVLLTHGYVILDDHPDEDHEDDAEEVLIPKTAKTYRKR